MHKSDLALVPALDLIAYSDRATMVSYSSCVATTPKFSRKQSEKCITKFPMHTK